MPRLNSRHLVKRWLRLIFLLLLWTLGPPAVLAQDPPAEELTPPFDPRFGVVDSFVNTAEANAAGAGWTRIFFRWDVIQPAGPSDWKPTNVPDTFIEAEIEAGREIAAVLIGTPSWATESSVSTAVPPPEFWGDFVFKIATQYRGRINHWIIWNQPDISDPTSSNYTWDGTEEDYYRLLKEAYLKIKAVDPNMQVHLAGLTYTWDQERGNRQYLERLLDIILADPQAANDNYYFDAAGYHIYYNPQQIYDILSDVRRLLDSRGLSHKAMWLAETNAPPSEDFLEPPSIPPPLSVSLQEQSDFVIQALAMALAGGAERVAINKMRNQPDALVLNGLLRSDNSRRPAFDAFRVVTTHFAGVQNATLQQVGSINVVTLERGEQTTTVLWNTDTSLANLPLPAIASTGLLVNEQGVEQPLTPANGLYTIELPGAICSNGSNCFIGGAPRLVVEAGSPAQRPALPALAAAPAATSLAVATNTPAAGDTPAPTPPPTLTPQPTTLAAPLPAADAPAAEGVIDLAPSPATGEAAPSAPAALPDPGRPEDDLQPTPDPAAGLEAIAPISFRSVMTPRRILWLFVIGIIVFMVTYGLQVVIWYRLKR